MGKVAEVIDQVFEFTAIGIDAGGLIPKNNKVEDKTSIHCRFCGANFERDEKGNPSTIKSDKPANDTVKTH
jgi:hypothetical protein